MAGEQLRKSHGKVHSLRERAEELLRKKPDESPTLPTRDVQELLHELNVHQMELEIQNEDLRNAQLELAHSRDRYSDLYEFAPVGFLALGKEGKILEANLTAATMLGVSRAELHGKNLSKFVAADWQDALHLHRQAVFSAKVKEVGEVGMHRADGTPMMIRLESIAFGPEADQRCRTALIDVTMRKNAEKIFEKLNLDLGDSLRERTNDLRHSVEEVRLLTEALSNLGEGVLITDNELDWPGSNIVFVNDAMCRASGYEKEELIGQTPRMLQGEATDAGEFVRIKELLMAGRSCLAEITSYRKDGSSYEAEMFIAPLWDGVGILTNFISIFRDITERKKIETALHESEERFRMIYEEAPLGIAVASERCELESCNAAYCEIMGATEEDLQGMDCCSIIHPEERSRYLEQCRDLRSGEMGVVRSENRFISRAGRRGWICSVMSMLPNGVGVGRRLMTLVSDITERRVAEEKVREGTERLLAIMDATVDALITIDTSGIIVDCNPSTERIFGYVRSELIGANLKMLMPSPHRDEHDGYIEQFLRTGHPRIIGTGREVAARRKDGSIFDADLTVTEVKGLGLFTGVIRDISRRKLLEQEVLNVAEDERQRIAHDLHDDLGSLLTGIKLVLEAMARSKGREAEAEKMREIAEHIGNAIQKTRTIAQGLRPVASDSEAFMSALQDLAHRTFSMAGITCRFSCEEPIRIDDVVLSNHLYRIAQEALNNAVKHSGAANIEISLRKVEGMVEMEIEDDGSGFDGRPEEVDGLGLHIMGYRTNAMRGSLRFERSKGGGTSVICIVPIPPSPEVFDQKD